MDEIEEQCEFTEEGEVVCEGVLIEELPEKEEEDDEDLKKEEEMKIWSIVYSKKPELIIDKDEYDRILIDLLQSYADFKQTTIKMDKL